MDFSFSEEDEAWRAGFRGWLEANPLGELGPPGPDGRETPTQVARLKDWQRRLFEAGYAGLAWPKEYGGQGMGITRQVIFQEELARSGVPRPIAYIGMENIGPAILGHGSEDQKRRWLPKILSAEEIWCQGFSEPNAGSDLASLQTQAVLDGDTFVVNGQKVWTSGGHYAQWCGLLCRTDPNVPKHRGISYLAVPMDSPGITVLPLRQVTGNAEFNQVFFEDVRVPRANLIGELNRGWYISQTTLGAERATGAIPFYVQYKRNFYELLERAREPRVNGRPALEEGALRQEIADIYTELEVMRLHGLRSLTTILGGHEPGSESSIAKIHWGLADRKLHNLALAVQGPYGQLAQESPDRLGTGRHQYGFLRALSSTIHGGTAQIQRNIIAERLLGMPR